MKKTILIAMLAMCALVGTTLMARNLRAIDKALETPSGVSVAYWACEGFTVHVKRDTITANLVGYVSEVSYTAGKTPVQYKHIQIESASKMATLDPLYQAVIAEVLKLDKYTGGTSKTKAIIEPLLEPILDPVE